MSQAVLQQRSVLNRILEVLRLCRFFSILNIDFHINTILYIIRGRHEVIQNWFRYCIMCNVLLHL